MTVLTDEGDGTAAKRIVYVARKAEGPYPVRKSGRHRGIQGKLHPYYGPPACYPLYGTYNYTVFAVNSAGADISVPASILITYNSTGIY